jgi:hypothetical protein
MDDFKQEVYQNRILRISIYGKIEKFEPIILETKEKVNLKENETEIIIQNICEIRPLFLLVSIIKTFFN